MVVKAEVNRMTFAERNQRQAVTNDIAFDLRLRKSALIDTGMRNFSGMRSMAGKEMSDGDSRGRYGLVAPEGAPPNSRWVTSFP